MVLILSRNPTAPLYFSFTDALVVSTFHFLAWDPIASISAWDWVSLSLSSLVLPVMDSPVLGVVHSKTKVEQP